MTCCCDCGPNDDFVKCVGRRWSEGYGTRYKQYCEGKICQKCLKEKKHGCLYMYGWLCDQCEKKNKSSW